MPQCARDGSSSGPVGHFADRVVARVAVRALRRVRVAGRHVEVALGVEAHAAADVAAAVDLGVVLEDPDLGVEVELLRLEVDREARDARLRHLRHAPLERQARRRAVRVEAREVLQVDVAGLREVGRDRDAEQAVLHLVVVLVGALAALPAVAVDGERAGARHAAVERAVGRRGIPDVDAAAADADVRVGVVEDAPERRQRRAASPRSASVRQSPRPM